MMDAVYLGILGWLSVSIPRIGAFQPLQATPMVHSRAVTGSAKASQGCNEEEKASENTRRGILASFALTSATAISPLRSGAANNPPSVYVPGIRPTAYLVDSTIPPTLLSFNNRKEASILKGLGQGSGTNKEAVLIDTVNLNNMLNKAVFGTIDAFSSVKGSQNDNVRGGPGYSSFVCLGLPSDTTVTDVELATSLVQAVIQPRKGKKTAVALWFAPFSAQASLDQYVNGGSEADLANTLSRTGVSEEIIRLYQPILQLSRQNSLDLIAMAPEAEDIATVRDRGIQFVDPNRRSQYVVDPEGFISLTNEPRFKLYTDRSLFKDFQPLNDKDTAGAFFAERILVHEAGATVMAKYGTQNLDSLVLAVAPTPDLRYLGGYNGRIPRVCAHFSGPSNQVGMNAVTTILLNPTARETLSASRYLRLEIGTGPDTLAYQTKVADYLWFSASPKVNLIPRWEMVATQ